MDEPDESILTTISKREDTRSDFDKAFEEDELFQLQNRMLAKAKTKKFTPEDFVRKAREELDGELEVVDTPMTDLEETPEPEEDIIKFF